MDDLARLRQILLGEELDKLGEIQKRLDDSHVRSKELAKVLPAAVMQTSKDPDKAFIYALEEPIELGLKSAINNNTPAIADALFPVMGPAIRRAISEALRGMMQSISETLDHSFSLKGLSWRFEAMRTGVPFHEVVLRHTMQYRVEQVFLIHRESGLLISHLAADEVMVQDPDAVSAMLTAIQDFTQDSFKDQENGKESESALRTIDVGEHSIWISHGPDALVAAAIRGVPPRDYRETLQAANEQIHQKYYEALEGFYGESAEFAGAETILSRCLTLQLKESKQKRKVSPALLIGLLILIALLAWWGVTRYQEHLKFNDLVTSLQQEAGIVVYESRKNGNGYVIRGLRDPYSVEPVQLVTAAGYEPDAVNMHFDTYQSLEGRITLKRARNILSPPDSVGLDLKGEVLSAAGSANKHWIERARILSSAIPGITTLDLERVLDPDAELQQKIRELLAPPDSVNISVTDGIATFDGTASGDWIASTQGLQEQLPALKGVQSENLEESDVLLRQSLLERIVFPRGVMLTVSDGIVTLTGEATLDWIESTEQLIAADTRVEKVVTEQLIPVEFRELDELAAKLNLARIFYGNAVLDASIASSHVRDTIRTINRLLSLADQVGRNMTITVVGHSDGDPESEANQSVANERAERFRQLVLTQVDVDADRITAVANVHAVEQGQDGSFHRRVDFLVQETE